MADIITKKVPQTFFVYVSSLFVLVLEPHAECFLQHLHDELLLNKKTFCNNVGRDGDMKTWIY